MGDIAKAIQWARDIAIDDSHGYSQAVRNGPDYDCSSFVINALEYGGFPMKNYGATYTGDMGQALILCGFRRVYGCNLVTGAGLKAGDVLLNPATHTELYIGGGYAVGAHCSETGGKYGKAGDQTGNEISIQKYRDKNYTQVWRYIIPKTDTKDINVAAKAVINGDYGVTPDRERRLAREGYNPTEVQRRVNELLKGGYV